MKNSTYLLALFLIAITYANAQSIKPPPGFKLIKANGTSSHIDHYVKDRLTFTSDGWTGSLPSDRLKFDAEIAKFLAENYRTSLQNDIHFTNGIYYGMAYYNNKYVFTVLDYDTVYKISSPTKDSALKKYSDWLLIEVNKHNKAAN